jgi:hypothetical protein
LYTGTPEIKKSLTEIPDFYKLSTIDNLRRLENRKIVRAYGIRITDESKTAK